MALIYADGFDAYGTADIAKRWTFVNGSGNFTVGSAAGRNGTGALVLSNFDNARITRYLGANRATLVQGFAFKFSARPTPGNAARIFAALDNGTFQFSLAYDSNGLLLLYSGGTSSSLGTLVGSYNANLQTGIFYYVEVQATISNSIASGSCIVNLNGATVLTPAAGSNLRGSSNNYATNIELGGQNVSGSWSSQYWYDDTYILDNTGSSNNAPLGDIRVECIRPTGAGSSTQFTATGAGTNFGCVNEAAEDGDTTYVVSSTINQVDLYAMGDLSSNPSQVMGIQVVMLARKDDAGNRVITSALKSGATQYDHGSSSTFALADGYTLFIDPWDLDPNGSVAWTGTSINALEAGVKLVS